MAAFSQNLRHLLELSGCKTDAQFAGLLGMERWTFNKLKNGSIKPTRTHLQKISEYSGFSIKELHLQHDKFLELPNRDIIDESIMFRKFRITQSHSQNLRSIFDKYQGNYIIYTYGSGDGQIIASLLNVNRLTRSGIEFEMINPYFEGFDQYQVYKYTGFLIPAEDYLYFFGEQEKHDYEILSMVFGMTGAPEVKMLRGLWTGIGVLRGEKYIASVTALAVKQDRPLEWRKELGEKIGYLQTDSLPEVIRRNIAPDILSVKNV